MMDANTQLEGWVQAKITKSADYIASLYHYLEYEMKFSEYGQAIDDSDVYTESQKRVLKAKLNEAKEKIKDLKKVQADKAKKKEKKEELSEARATDKKKGAVTKSEKSQYFAKTTSKDGKVTKGSTHEAEEGETEGDVRDRVERDAKSKGDTVDSFRKKELDEAKSKKAKRDFDKDGEVETEKEEVIGSRRRAAGLPVKEASDEKCNHTAKGKKCPVHGLKECGSYMEGKPSAGMTAKEKSAVAKKATAGKDIGKPGKSFDKVAKAAGGGEKGTKIAAAAMWKNQAKK